MHHVPKVSGLEFILSSSMEIDGELKDGEEAGFLTRDEGYNERVFLCRRREIEMNEERKSRSNDIDESVLG